MTSPTKTRYAIPATIATFRILIFYIYVFSFQLFYATDILYLHVSVLFYRTNLISISTKSFCNFFYL